MSSWEVHEAQALTGPQEVQVITRRQDGSLRRPRTIWTVGDGHRVFIRSTNGPTADWYRWATATGTGQVRAAGKIYDITFIQANDADLTIVDRAFRAKYGHYASIVDHLEQPAPRSATLEVHPR